MAARRTTLTRAAKGTMRLAVMARDTANGRYRAVLPLQELHRRGHAVCWPGHPSFEILESGGVPPWDLLHMQQSIGDGDLEIALRLRAHGIAVIWDTDDDIQAAPKGSATYKQLGRKRGMRKLFDRTVEMACAAHLLTATTEHLAQIYRAAGVEHVRAIENHLDPGQVGRPRPRHQGVVIGLVASDEHVEDLERLRIADVLSRILDAHEGIRVIALGRDLKLRDHRYLHQLRVPFDQLYEIERQFDIGLAPLVDSPMSRARSNVKLKEYAAAGAMWLASPVGPYVGMGEEQGGLLVGDGDWYDTLDGLIRDHERRLDLAKRAQAWARKQTIVQAGDQWEAAFRDAIVRAQRNGGG